jgi:Cu+-exporting ATPase
VIVALLAQKAEVKYDASYILPSQIANKISSLGFNSTVMESESAGQGTVELNVSTDYCCQYFICIAMILDDVLTPSFHLV